MQLPRTSKSEALTKELHSSLQSTIGIVDVIQIIRGYVSPIMRLLTPRDLSTETGNRFYIHKMEYHVQLKRWLLNSNWSNWFISWTPNQPHVTPRVSASLADIYSFAIDQRNGDVIFDLGCDGLDLGRLRDGKVEWISVEPSFQSLVPKHIAFHDLCISKTGVIYGADTENGLVRCLKPKNNASDSQSSYSLSTLKIGSRDECDGAFRVALSPAEKTLVVECSDCIYIINLESGEFTALIGHNSRYDASRPSFNFDWFERDAKRRGAKSILRTAVKKWTDVLPLSDTKLLFVGPGPAHVHDLKTDKVFVLTDIETFDSSDEWRCASIDPTNNRDLYLASVYGDICMLPNFLPL